MLCLYLLTEFSILRRIVAGALLRTLVHARHHALDLGGELGVTVRDLEKARRAGLSDQKTIKST